MELYFIILLVLVALLGFLGGYFFDFGIKVQHVRDHFFELARQLDIEEKQTMFRDLSQKFSEDISEMKYHEARIASLSAQSVKQNQEMIDQITRREEKTIEHLKDLAEGLQQWNQELNEIMTKIDRIAAGKWGK